MGRKASGKKISIQQKNILLEFLEGNSKVARGKINSSFTAKESAVLWQNVAIRLNHCDGPKKTWKEWRKTWHDIKNGVKGRVAAIEAAETGAGPPTSMMLTNFYMRVKDLLERTANCDPNETSESPVIKELPEYMAFDDIGKHESGPDICMPAPPIPTSSSQTYISPVHPEFPFSYQSSCDTEHREEIPSNEHPVIETSAPPSSSHPKIDTRQNEPSKRRKVKPFRRVIFQMRGILGRTEEAARESLRIQEEQLKLKARVVQVKEDYYKRKLELLGQAVDAIKSISQSFNKQ
ncbi:uncharacterized protein LOC124165270 [Ischnura elegans]|uniref:uncharacterized protein LOC124165270 n=1 Tax=Ischnura elegans TaxID=197161 RepID=UPI001ED8B361|nr:uncharacterized protein LOC124165270 [Ischnura elegans]XP_046398557.1 uncharacterized protein LOC124165270 [Ischnura elegans]